LSTDKPAAQDKWIQKKELNFPLLSDPNSELLKKLGAFTAPKK
jgi:peroxiredoxin Q/BCP